MNIQLKVHLNESSPEGHQNVTKNSPLNVLEPGILQVEQADPLHNPRITHLPKVAGALIGLLTKNDCPLDAHWLHDIPTT